VLTLGAKWAKVLVSQPETGMGYQVTTVRLKDGRKFDRVVIVEGRITKIADSDDIPFTEDQIDQIIVTHDRL
jgi:hypothetical protein